MSLRHAVASSVWWVGRLLVLALAAYLVARLVALLSVVTIPLLVAGLLTAVLVPVRSLVERTGLPRLPAALLTFLAGLLVLSGVVALMTMRISANAPQIADSARQTLDAVRSTLAHGLPGIGSTQLSTLQDRVTTWLHEQQGQLVGAVATGLNLTLRAVVGVFLTGLLTVLLLWDGDRLWRVVNRVGDPAWAAKVDRAGRSAWHSLAGYINGTLVIATFHGVVIGTTLVVIGVPLAAVLAVGVFLGSFVPLVGALVAGGAAVLVTLATRGVVDALVVLAVLVAANQVEAHILQPVVMRRFTRIHPLVIVLAVASFSTVWGVIGALIAVPVCAVVARAAPVLLGPPEGVDSAGTGEPEDATSRGPAGGS